MLALYGWGLEADLGGDAPAALLARLVAGGLPFRDTAGARLFDPAEVVNRVIAGGLAAHEPAWAAHFVETGRALVRSLDPEAPVVLSSAPRRFRMRFERRFDLRAIVGRGSVRLRLPRPIEDGALTDLEIAVTAPIGSVTQAPARIELRLAGALPPTLTAGWTAAFISRPDAVDETLGEAERARWLAADEGLIRVTPPVRDLAERLAGGLSAPPAVAAFRDYLLDRCACGIIAYEAIAGPATDHVLAGGWYDCQLGSALLVALCRARGIPARLVGGYLLWPAAPSRHVWCEIWLDGGWRAIDLLAWDLSAGGRDADWRDVFANGIGHRMKTEVLPDLFAGPMSLPFPAAHHRLLARYGSGIEIDHVALDGTPIYRDRISVTADPA